jgi:hypothetical protein
MDFLALNLQVLCRGKGNFFYVDFSEVILFDTLFKEVLMLG